MSRNSWIIRAASALTVAVGFLLAFVPVGALSKINDRKFPTGTFCPLESRSAAGADLSFVAGGPAARITFAADNLKGTCEFSGAPCLDETDCLEVGEVCQRFCSTSFDSCATDVECPSNERCGTWNRLLLDNVTVVPQSVFDAALLSPSPFYEDCYFDTVPPGQTTGGISGAPSYDHVAGGPEAFLSLFDGQAAVSAWSGDAYFEATTSAPRNPAGPTFEDLDETGGSLGVGTVADGERTVSASALVTGLTPGETYVVFGWWSIQFADSMVLTIEENACVDGDGDRHVVCDGCTPGPDETCGECDDANPDCTTDCTDVDQDGLCPPADCDDTAATCGEDCTTDLDGDGVPVCLDSCVDPDGDGYGTAGGAGSTCSASDCLEGNPLCNVSCVDSDNDEACLPADCDDADPARRPGAVEINDCMDQQCPGEPGYGVTDETSGTSGFFDLDKDRYSWPAQQGATLYQAISSGTPDFSAGCELFTTMSTLWDDATPLAAGEIRFYMNRPLDPCTGSWGQTSALAERTVCPGEICSNGIDDDGDALTDCADPDCAAAAACQPSVFTFVDGTGDDIATTAFRDFLLPLSVGSDDWFYFEIEEQGWDRNVAWCAENAAFYRTAYLDNAFGAGSVFSGSWNRWYRFPSTISVWFGPVTSALPNDYGDNSFGEGSWCSEQFPSGPMNCLFPNRTNDCEAYDMATGACAISAGLPWTVTIRVGPTRASTCGF